MLVGPLPKDGRYLCVLLIAVSTARTHLQHIFEKTNVNSQAELVRLVMNSSLQLSVPERDTGPRKKSP